MIVDSHAHVVSRAALASVLLLGAPGFAAAKEPIEIGMAAALTGFLANYDGQFIDGVKLAVKQANDAGGIDGHMLNLHILDDASNATTGVTVTNQLLNQYNVSVMLNGLSSAQTAAIEPIVARAKVPMIVISVLPPDPIWTFGANLRSEKADTLEIEFGKESLHAGKVAIAYSQTPYGQIGGKVTNEAAQRLGLQVVFSEGVENATTDMTPQMAKIKDAVPDFVADIVTGSVHIVEAKAAATVGLKVPLVMGSDDLPLFRQATAIYLQTYFVAAPAQAYPHVANAGVKAAYEAFQAAYRKAGLDEAEVSGASYGWDAVKILSTAVAASGATGGDKLRAALETITVQGTNTLYKYSAADHTGQMNVPNALQIGRLNGDAVEIVYSGE